MPRFQFTATDQYGNKHSGQLHADNRLEANYQLRQQGMSAVELTLDHDPPPGPTKITPPPPASAKRPWSFIFSGVSLSALAVFFRQFATLINAGLPMHQALQTLVRQTRSGPLQRIVQNLSDDVLSGKPVSQGMARHAHVFTPLQISLMRAGEEGGMLDKTLAQIADHQERELDLRRLIRRITFYPKTVLAFAVLMPIVVPWIIRSIAGANAQSDLLPDTSRILVYYLPLAVTVYIAFRIALRSATVRQAWDWIKLQPPILGSVVRQFAMAKFGRALGALYAGGVPIARAIVVASDACGNSYIAQTIKPAATRIEQGQQIALSLHETGCFPPMALDMISTGEQTGDLDRMLFSLADYYEAEATTKAHVAATAFGVFALLIAAIVVGSMVISFYRNYFGAMLGGA